MTSLKSRFGRGCAVLAIPLGLAVLAACGDDSSTVAKDPADSTSPAASTSSGLPACADIWKDGGTIPQKYRGCDDDGTAVKADRKPCASGQVLVTYADTFYGVLGGPVNAVPEGLSKSSKYRSASGACG